MDRLQGLRLESGRGLSSRAALLQYSSQVKIEQTFRDWRGIENFKARVAPIQYIGHGTYTTYAITNLTRIYLEESGTKSIKVAVLLFDGISHPRNPNIFDAVDDARNQGVRFFTIGITPEANEATNIAQLRRIASSPATRYLHNLQDVGIVDKVIKEIVSKKKQCHSLHPCWVIVDLVNSFLCVVTNCVSIYHIIAQFDILEINDLNGNMPILKNFTLF